MVTRLQEKLQDSVSIWGIACPQGTQELSGKPVVVMTGGAPGIVWAGPGMLRSPPRAQDGPPQTAISSYVRAVPRGETLRGMRSQPPLPLGYRQRWGPHRTGELAPTPRPFQPREVHYHCLIKQEGTGQEVSQARVIFNLTGQKQLSSGRTLGPEATVSAPLILLVSEFSVIRTRMRLLFYKMAFYPLHREMVEATPIQSASVGLPAPERERETSRSFWEDAGGRGPGRGD